MIFSDSPLDRVDIVQKMVCRYCLVLVGAWSGPCTRHEVPLSRCYRSLLTKISQNLEIKNRSSPLGVTFLTIACMMPHYCVSHRSASAHSHLHPESQMAGLRSLHNYLLRKRLLATSAFTFKKLF